MDLKSNKHEVYYDELINLISGNTDIASQYIIFTNSDDEYYAINVAKVEELIRNKDIRITKSSKSDDLTLGVTKIRDDFIVMLNFDDWIGKSTDKISDLSLIIICIYNKKKIGLIVKNVIGIQSLSSINMHQGTTKDDKVSYIVEVSVGGEERLCNIFDYDKLIMDIFTNNNLNSEFKSTLDIDTNIILSDKLVLIAEDSQLIQGKLKPVLDSLGCHYEMYNDGKMLLDSLSNRDINEVSLIITDIEMPVMDGITLLKNIYENDIYNSIPTIIHTNMGNAAIRKKADDYKVKDLVSKLNMEHLKESIIRYIR